MKEKYPILSEFLQAVCWSINFCCVPIGSDRHAHIYAHTSKETELRATQYLPDIARLQQCLYDKFNQQIDRKDVKKQTIQSFIKELPNGMYIDKLKFGF